MPKFKRLPLVQIDEPALAVRATMDEQALAELSADIKGRGVIVPIGVVEAGERWQIIWGHRRYLASLHAGVSDIPALCHRVNEADVLSQRYAENFWREDVTAAEEAVFFAQIMDAEHCDTDGVAARVRKTRHYVEERLRLMNDDQDVFQAVLRRAISFAVGRELNKVSLRGADEFTRDWPEADKAAFAEAADRKRRYYLSLAKETGASQRTVTEWLKCWRMEAGVMAATPAPPPLPVAQNGDIYAPPIACHFCKGYADPHNLVSIFVHRWELATIDKVLQSESEKAG